MDINERFEKFFEYKGIKRSEFERRCGLSNGYTRNLRDSPKSEKMKDILNAFPELNPSWLLTGDGQMLNATEEAVSDRTERANRVPLLPIFTHGGALNDYVVAVKDIECEKIISPIQADLAITVTGDSMAPEYPSGSKIFIKKINEKAFLEWGKVYVLDTVNGTVIKEVRKGKDDTELECVSINTDPKFQPFTVKLADIYGIYRVLMCMAMK